MDELKYPWQQAVLEAFRASPESLPVKINIAQKAIASRQKERAPLNAFEQIAIREALHALGKLLEESRANAPRRIHFHIRWSSGKLDWDRFDSRRDAESAAQELVRRDETYMIEEFSDDCMQCRAIGYWTKDTA